MVYNKTDKEQGAKGSAAQTIDLLHNSNKKGKKEILKKESEGRKKIEKIDKNKEIKRNLEKKIIEWLKKLEIKIKNVFKYFFKEKYKELFKNLNSILLIEKLRV